MAFCYCLKYSITIIVRQFKAVSILLYICLLIFCSEVWHTFRGSKICDSLWRGQKSSKIAWHTLWTAPWTKYSVYKILWLVSLQIHKNLNTLHQYSKNYIGFQSNSASILIQTVFLHIKRFKFSNLLIFTIVFLFLLTLCLQDHLLIHRFCPSHMSEHLWAKGPFLSLLQ